MANAIKHQLTDVDTLASLAIRYLSDEGRAADIAAYNNLVHPYISTDWEDRYTTFAHGYVLLRRSMAAGAVTIKKNWRLHSKAGIISNVKKTFIVTEDTTLAAGQLEVYVPVRSLIGGVQGNTQAGAVGVLGEEFTRNALMFSTVANTEPITGGREGKVLTSGDFIYIPMDEGASEGIQDAGYRQATYFYGSDIALEAGDVAYSGSGDIKAVSFYDNVIQAVQERLVSEEEDNPNAREFSTNIREFIGNADVPLEVLPQRLEVEILRALSNEDRLLEAKVETIVPVPSEGAVYIDLSVRILSTDEQIQLPIAVRRNV